MSGKRIVIASVLLAGSLPICPASAAVGASDTPGAPDTYGEAVPAAERRPCPLVFGHGGYPGRPGATVKDRIRQPNHPRGLADHRRWGADGVEADVQLTRHGTKAVMWHNTTTNGLTGPRRRITELRWSTGPGNLRSRRISRGPYRGERVYTLRQWLDHARRLGLIALLEIKGEAKRILRDPAHAARGWREISRPIRERQRLQRILVYSRDPWIQRRLAERHPDILRGSAVVWTDGVRWDEPPPFWVANVPRWEAVLAKRPYGVLTNYPKQYRRWLTGECG